MNVHVIVAGLFTIRRNAERVGKAGIGVSKARPVMNEPVVLSTVGGMYSNTSDNEQAPMQCLTAEVAIFKQQLQVLHQPI